jgi:Mg-chelatase subunit ChlD
MSMDMFYYSRIAYARTIAENTGLTLKEEEGVDAPRTDGRTIFVPIYNHSWDYHSSEAQEWWGKFLHEIYHNDTRYDHPKALKLIKANAKELTQMLKYTWNLLEDHRIESDEWGEFPGRDSSMSILRRNMFKTFKEDIVKKGTGNPKMDAIYWLQWATFGTWMPDLGYIDIRIELPEDTQKYISIVEKYIKEIIGLSSAEECWELSKKIVKELVDDSPKTKKGKGKGKTEGEEENGDEVEAEYGKYNMHEHEQSDKPEEDGDPARVKAKPKVEPHVIPPMKEIRPNETGSDRYGDRIGENVHTEGLASQIKRYLLVKVQSKTINNQKSGRIDTSSLWKASVYRGQPAGGRVFQKNAEHMNLDTAVALLVDQSGSMSGSRIINAAAAAVTLNEVFSKIGVKTRITSFTDNHLYTINYLHKDYSESVNKEKLIKRMAVAATEKMSGNADGENILWEFNKIANRPEQKKLMIVLSDGQPCDSKTGNIYDFTMDVIKGVEKSKVGIIGIGIETDAVETFYKRFRVLNDSSKIESTLLDILSNEVLHA